jgi:glutaconyl-CoA/methylmalonyl-CoA decarboxylase subunit delta
MVKIFNYPEKGKKKKQTEPEKPEEAEITGEICAAIGLALHLHLEDYHDYERTLLTIQKAIRPYSPWSSKIYGLRQIPFKYPRQK